MAVAASKAKDNDADKPKPTTARETVLVDTAEAHIDRVAMVSRDKNGNPDQGNDYELLVDDDASDEQKRRAENRPEDNRIDTA